MKKKFLCSVLSVAILFSFTACSSISEEIVAALGQAPDRMQQTEISQSSQSSERPQSKETPPPASSTPKIIEIESSESEVEVTESLPPAPVEVNIPEVYGSLKIRDYSWTAARLKIVSSNSPPASSKPSQTSNPTRTNSSSKASSSSRASSQAEFVRKETNYSKQNWPKGAVLATSAKTKKPVYHIYNCRAADKILPENEIWYDSAEEARKDGRVLCGICGK